MEDKRPYFFACFAPRNVIDEWHKVMPEGILEWGTVLSSAALPLPEALRLAGLAAGVAFERKLEEDAKG